MDKRLITIVFALATAASASGLEADQVQISCVLRTAQGELAPISHTMEWTFERLEGDRALVHLRAPLGSFDSGHPALDRALRGALGSELVEVEGTAVSGRFDGTLSLHGRTRALRIPIQVDRLEGAVIAAASFAIDLRDFGVSAPGVDPRVKVEFVAHLVASPQAVVAFGSVKE